MGVLLLYFFFLGYPYQAVPSLYIFPEDPNKLTYLAAVQTIPLRFISKEPIEVRTMPQEWFTDDNEDWLTIGIYADNPPRLSVSQKLNEPKASQVFLHEYAHYIWRHELSSKERSLYGEVWRTNKQRLPTSYSKTNYTEGFAEEFSYWCLQKDTPNKPYFESLLLSKDTKMDGRNKGGGKVPASNSGNRKDPAQKLGLGGAIPPNRKSTYGAGDGPGGGQNPAKNSGNRKDPAQKIGLSGVTPPNLGDQWRPIK